MNIINQIKELSLQRSDIRSKMVSLLKDRSIPLEDRYDAMMSVVDFNLTSIDWVFDEDEVLIIDSWGEL